jgi:hypothetical protein
MIHVLATDYIITFEGFFKAVGLFYHRWGMFYVYNTQKG